MWTVRLSSRKAACQSCKCEIHALAPRVDWSTGDINWEKGDITRRYCLECGLKKMKEELESMLQTINQSIRIWNMLRERHGWPKKREPDYPKIKWPKEIVKEEGCRRAKS